MKRRISRRRIRRLPAILLAAALMLTLFVGVLPASQPASAATTLDSMAVKITMPTPGAKPVFKGESGDSTKYSVNDIIYQNAYDGTLMAKSDTFIKGGKYKITVYVKAASGYEIDKYTTLTVNRMFQCTYHGWVTDHPDTAIYELVYEVGDRENDGKTKLGSVTVTGIQVPVVGEELSSAVYVPSGGGYAKDSYYNKIRWSRKDGGSEPTCSEGETVQDGMTYYATITLRSQDDRPFDADHTIKINAYTLYGVELAQNKIVKTTYTLRSDNMVMDIKLEFRACSVYDYTYEFTNAPGKTHGMPRIGEQNWDYQDVSPNQYSDSEQLNTLSLRWRKYGTDEYLDPVDTFQVGQYYELSFGIADGYTAIIRPGTIIVYYDDVTSLYFEGTLDGTGTAVMKNFFKPVDPVLRDVSVVRFRRPAAGETVSGNITALADPVVYGTEYELVSQVWYDKYGGGDGLPDSTVFEGGSQYYYSVITLRPLTDHSFESGTTVTITDYSGNDVPVKEVKLQSDGTLRIRTENFYLTESIDTVYVDYKPPTVGKTAGACMPTNSSDSHYQYADKAWFMVTDDGGSRRMEDDELFEAGAEYRLWCSVEARTGYTLSSDTRAAVINWYTDDPVNHSKSFSGKLYITTEKETAVEAIGAPVQVSGYRRPAAGDISAETEASLSVPEGCGYEITDAYWVDESYSRLGDYARLEAGKKYALCVELDSQDGYYYTIRQDLGDLKLYDDYGREVTGTDVQWTGAGEHAFGYIPGTQTLRFYTTFAEAAEVIRFVQFDLDEPVTGALPDYEPLYAADAHYYSSTENDDEWVRNDIDWDYMYYGDTFYGDSHFFNIVITAEDGYVFPKDVSDIAVTFNNHAIQHYQATVETTAANKLSLSVTTDPGAFRYKVTFVNLGYGAIPPAQYVTKGDKAVKPADPTEYGMAFRGWYADASLTAPYDFDAPVTKDITLYARWESAETHLVRFLTDGRGEEPADQYVADGEKAAKPADLTESGWIFGGWYADPACTVPFDFDAPITDDVYVYAWWTEVDLDFSITPSTCTFSAVEGYDPVTAELTVRNTGNTQLYFRDTADTEHFRVGGIDRSYAEPGEELHLWVTAKQYLPVGTYTDTVTVTAEDGIDGSATVTKTVSVTFEVTEKSSFTVSFLTDHGTAPASQTVDYGRTISRPADPTAEGWSFGGWYTEASAIHAYIFSSPVTSDFSLYAKWIRYITSGDVDGDGDADDADIIRLVQCIRDGEKLPAADVTGDGRIDYEDLAALIQAVRGGIAPDAAALFLQNGFEYEAALVLQYAAGKIPAFPEIEGISLDGIALDGEASDEPPEDAQDAGAVLEEPAEPEAEPAEQPGGLSEEPAVMQPEEEDDGQEPALLPEPAELPAPEEAPENEDGGRDNA